MTDNISRRLVLAGLLAGAGQAGWASPPTSSLRPLLRPGAAGTIAVPGANELISAAGIGGKVAYVLADATSGVVLESHNPLLGLPPASVAKIVTAQYALETLGAEHRFKTRLMAVGPIVGGRLTGDLVLLGGGDPALNTNALAEMAAALKATGLREITGRFLVSSGTLPQVEQIDIGQPAHLGYNPAISGLNLNYNRVYFEWKKLKDDYAVTMDARSARYRPEVALTRMTVVDRASPIYTYSSGDSKESWTVARRALGKKGARWLPVRQPELYAGEVFQIFARSHGIQLPVPKLVGAPATGTVLVERQSRDLAAILKGMLARSNNLTAEVIGLSASVARGSQVSGLGQSANEMSRWMKAGLGAGKPRFVDHSGLGDDSRISASDMVSALVSIGGDSLLASLLKTSPLKHAGGKPAHAPGIELRVKTGSLNFVSALSGFIRIDGKRDLAFAVFTADMARRRAIAPAARERPPGARGWGRRARNLQRALVERWVQVYV